MTIEVTMTIKTDKGTKTFALDQTAEPVKNKKTGKLSLAHFQSKDTNKIAMSYGKVYIDTAELDKELSARPAKKS